ncbi:MULTISPECIES: DUF4331 domain-containing protein [unclassified Janthinobacterium]|uniref:DUF4331 domain-containing protein n=1 Tax=unclassified Janthinobacterium TaxID=2610881 RepID=UPI00034AB852|nr:MULTISPECIES: DUF4331 domain-containing protein [unclassified Janthinobacterium]MEC5159752.1 hypothetical protein [Janthinobacterium sp. CG_S6]
MSVTAPKTAIAAAILSNLIACAFAPAAFASSHREAPFITRTPKVDATDFYMFRSYEAGRDKFVTLVANYVPLQDAYGGPNYFAMDPDALYEIHIDNNGDAKEDLTFQFRFANTIKDAQFTVGGKKVSIPLVINGGAIDSVNPAGINVRETYGVTVVRGDRRHGSRAAVTNASGGAAVFDKPIDNIGKKAIPDYAAYAAKHVYSVNIPGCATPARLFVGQRKDSFAVNLGETFDLINIKAPAVEFSANAEKGARDDLADKNVTSIELEVATACLTASGGAEPVIGGWTTASLRQGRLLNPSPKGGADTSKEGGAWVQVSRLGMPLVNEVVIGLKDKDRFNHSAPSADGQFADYVTNPTLPALVEVLFGSAGAKAPTNFPRNDLVATFLTGIKGVNQPANVKAAEMLRLNTSTAPTPIGAQKRLGVIDGDGAGFPNGRRPGDDVVDVALRVVMGKLCTLNIGCAPADAPAGAIRFTDGAFLDESYFGAGFPYLKTPIAGSPQQ